jgi:hypothetical protein
MKVKTLLLGGIAAASVISAGVWAQGMKGPAAPAPRAFAQWDKV